MPSTTSSIPPLSYSVLTNLLGKQIDSEDVLAFAQEHDVRTPLKPTTDTQSTRYFTVKRPDLEVSWTHLLRTRETYPPRKQGRHYHCFISTIWFDLDVAQNLPSGIVAGMRFEDAVKLPDAKLYEHRSGRKWLVFDVASAPLPAELIIHLDLDTGLIDNRSYLDLIGADLYQYLRSDAVSHAFAPWHPSWPKEQADLPIGMLMAWAILRGDVGEYHLRMHSEQVQAVRQRRMTGREFLYACAYENELWSTDFAPRLNRFLHSYVHNMCNRNSAPFGRNDRCNVEDDFVGVFNPLLANGGLLAADDWANYERFAYVLDARWREWEITDLKTEISPEEETQLKPLYAQLSKLLAGLPAPAALTQTATVRRALPRDTTELLLSVFSLRTDDPYLQEVAETIGFEFPKASASGHLEHCEMITAGLVIGFKREDQISQERKAALSKEELKYLSSKRIQTLCELQFIADGATIISHESGNYAICSGYVPPLPLKLEFGAQLADIDDLFGEDILEEREDDEDGQRTRRWDFVIPRPSSADAPEAEDITLKLLLGFQHQALNRVKMVLG